MEDIYSARDFFDADGPRLKTASLVRFLPERE
jgi:hypothetical protein